MAYFSKKGKRLKRCGFPGMQRASWFQKLTDTRDQGATSASRDPDRHRCGGSRRPPGVMKEMYSLAVLEARSRTSFPGPKPRCCQDSALSPEAPGKIHFSPLPAAGSCRHALACAHIRHQGQHLRPALCPISPSPSRMCERAPNLPLLLSEGLRGGI